MSYPDGSLAFEKWFWSRVDVRAPNECWLWKGARISTGYGNFGGGSKPNRWARLSHRTAYELTYGPLHDLDCLHTCDNPPCCNPAHLAAGTAKANARDMVDKGRCHSRGKPGEDNGAAKLTAEQVLEIRRLYEPRKMSYRKLGQMFDVDHSAIYLIIKRKKWGHI